MSVVWFLIVTKLRVGGAALNKCMLPSLESLEGEAEDEDEDLSPLEDVDVEAVHSDKSVACPTSFGSCQV